jgi:serine/threonine protein kinase
METETTLSESFVKEYNTPKINKVLINESEIEQDYYISEDYSFEPPLAPKKELQPSTDDEEESFPSIHPPAPKSTISRVSSSQPIQVKILHSRLPEYLPGTIVKFQLGESCGQGSYGTIFKIDTQAYVVKFCWEDSTYVWKSPMESVEWAFWKNVFEHLKELSMQWPKYWGEVLILGTLTSMVRAKERVFPNGSPVLFMPFYFNWDDLMNTLFQDTKRDEKKLLHIQKELLEACCVLQREWCYVHLDLKLGNIMVDLMGNFRIIDFGMLEPIATNSHLQKSFFPNWNITSVQKLSNEVWGQETFPVLTRDVLKESYYIWPPGPCSLHGIMTYSLAVTQLEMIYGRNIYKFMGTRLHWKKYLQDLRSRNYPSFWVDILEESSYALLSPCELLDKINNRLKILENVPTRNWKKDWEVISKRLIRWRKLDSQENKLQLFIINEELPSISKSRFRSISEHFRTKIGSGFTP